ncbi:MAG: ComF family protein [Candidatus Omnitrophica bacterium]|nr:ComF family protein [Candidatus Omnitrophota bacterium]
MVYPPHCILCKTNSSARLPRHPLCPQCQHQISWNTPPFCPKCSRHLGSAQRARCRDCQQTPMHFDFAWSACLYQDLLRTLIHKFKYEQKTYLRFFLTQLMIDFIHRHELDIAQFDLLVPIPLFPTRLRERGYNQSLLLTQQLSKTFNIPYADHHLIRVRPTETQTHLSRKERWTNIEHAFKIKAPWKVRGQSILIIDDLMTTGATASTAAQCLKQSGAKTVAVLTPAITL